jgi:hypothetical protein
MQNDESFRLKRYNSYKKHHFFLFFWLTVYIGEFEMKWTMNIECHHNSVKKFVESSFTFSLFHLEHFGKNPKVVIEGFLKNLSYGTVSMIRDKIKANIFYKIRN